MSQDHAASPFSALSYQEQQRRWMEWRSRQLDYQPVSDRTPPAKPQPSPNSAGNAVPPLRQPNMPISAPVRRRELDQVLSRHRDAARRAGAYQPVSQA